MESFRVDFNVLSGNSTGLLLQCFLYDLSSHITQVWLIYTDSCLLNNTELLKTSCFKLNSSCIEMLFAFMAIFGLMLLQHFTNKEDLSYHEVFLPLSRQE